MPALHQEGDAAQVFDGIPGELPALLYAFKVLGKAASLGDVSAAAPALDLGAIYRPDILRGGQVGLSVQNVVAGSLDLGGPTSSLGRSFRLGLASPEWRFGRLMAGRAVADLAWGGMRRIDVHEALRLQDTVDRWWRIPQATRASILR